MVVDHDVIVVVVASAFIAPVLSKLSEYYKFTKAKPQLGRSTNFASSAPPLS